MLLHKKSNNESIEWGGGAAGSTEGLVSCCLKFNVAQLNSIKIIRAEQNLIEGISELNIKRNKSRLILVGFCMEFQ